MLRWSASQFCIASRQNVEKCKQCWDQPLPKLSLGRARDIGKIIVFQGKRIDFRIIGILENLLFSTKNKQTIFRTKTNGKLHQICTKSLKNVTLQESMRIFFFDCCCWWCCCCCCCCWCCCCCCECCECCELMLVVWCWCFWWCCCWWWWGERERSGKQEQQKERREQKSKAGPYTLPNSRSPASGGNYMLSISYILNGLMASCTNLKSSFRCSIILFLNDSIKLLYFLYFICFLKFKLLINSHIK